MTKEKKPERRGGDRRSIVDTAQFIDVRTKSNWKARLYDLSPTGCYLEMMNPPPKGTEIRVRLTLGGESFEAQALVVRYEQHMGIGVRFTEIDEASRRILEQFLSRTE